MHVLESQAPRIEETVLDGVAVFTLGGEFDAHSAPELGHRLVHVIEGGQYQVVVDMHLVTFVDLSTLTAIIDAMKLVYRHNGHLVVTTISRPVLRAIDLAGMRHSLRVFPSLEEAIGALTAPPSAA